MRRCARWLPLAAVLMAAAWPLLLWLVHRADPVAAVRLAHAAGAALGTAALALAAAALLLGVAFPPAPAWLRLVGSRTWRALTTDPRPLQRALAELQHFETAQRHYDAGRLLRQRGHHEQSLAHLRRAVELDDGLAGAFHQLGLACAATRRWPEAAAAFDAAERLDPGHAFGDALLWLGRAQHELGDPAALPTLLAHRQQHGGGPRSQLWLADALERAGDAAGAAEALRAAAAPPPRRLSPEDNWCRALARTRTFWSSRR